MQHTAALSSPSISFYNIHALQCLACVVEEFCSVYPLVERLLCQRDPGALRPNASIWDGAIRRMVYVDKFDSLNKSDEFIQFILCSIIFRCILGR